MGEKKKMRRTFHDSFGEQAKHTTPPCSTDAVKYVLMLPDKIKTQAGCRNAAFRVMHTGTDTKQASHTAQLTLTYPM